MLQELIKKGYTVERAEEIIEIFYYLTKDYQTEIFKR